MVDRTEPPRGDQPRAAGWENADWSRNSPPSPPASPAPQASQEPRASAFERFIGGNPAMVAIRLLVVSLIVGAVLMWLDIRPYEIFDAIERFFYRIWRMGFAAVREIIDYVIIGAVIVVPIWFVLRLFSMRR